MSQRVQDLYEEDEFGVLLENARMNAANDLEDGKQEVTIISEPGMYRLVGRSNKPVAKTFNRWLCHDVLPAIRKTGRYDARQTPPAPSLLNRRWLIVIDDDGRETARLLDPEHFLTKLAELPGMLRDPAFMIDGDQLAEIIHACTDRLASKLAGSARRAA